MSESKYTRDQIFEKVKKLLELANHEATNPNLAASAAEKASQMMLEWTITENEIAAASGKKDAPVYVVEAIPFLVTKVWPWENWLVSHVSKAFLTYVVTFAGNKEHRIYGQEQDVKMASFVYIQLRTTLDAMCRKAFQVHAEEYKEKYGTSVYKKSNAQAYRGKWLTSWMDGAVQEVGKKLKAQQAAATQDNSMAMVLVETRGNEAKAFAHGQANIVPAKVRKVTVFTEAQIRGAEAGKNLQIRKGLEAGTSPNKLSAD
jgi:hypothetical protein